jgi:hypothetical protein
MKRYVLIVCGAAMLLGSNWAGAQEAGPVWNGQLPSGVVLQGWQRDESRGRDDAGPAPRGDLRSDISNNARTHFDLQDRGSRRGDRR